MNGSAMKRLNEVLAMLHSYEDSWCLAGMILEYGDSAEPYDNALENTKTQLLTILIDHERREAAEPNLYNIWALLATNRIDEALKNDPAWHAFCMEVTPRLRQNSLLALEEKLAPFRLMSPAYFR
jgi:hypothetical protein